MILRLSIIVSLFIFSCSSNEKEKSDANIIEKEKMISLLTEMYALEGRLVQGQLITSEKYKKGTAEYQALFKKYNTDKETVSRSIDYYVNHPEIMREIQVRVLDSLTLKAK